MEILECYHTNLVLRETDTFPTNWYLVHEAINPGRLQLKIIIK